MNSEKYTPEQIEEEAENADAAGMEFAGRMLRQAAQMMRERLGNERIVHDFPKLSAFFQKHALGSKLPTSCFTCGKVGKRSITHAELADIYVCENCAQMMREREVGGAADDVLVRQLRGRAQFLCDMGRVKSPELMERAASAIESFAAHRSAVPDGWKLVPVELLVEVVQVLRNVDAQLRATGQPSARIERAINALSPLAAAPESP